MRKIALIGAGNPRWQETLIEFQKQESAVFTDWTYRIRDHELNQLEKQIESDGEFKLFFYEPKSRGGDMKIRLIGYVSEFITSDSLMTECPDSDYFYLESESSINVRTWLKINRFETIAHPMALSEFWDHRTRRRITPSHLKSSFAYVADTKEMVTEKIEMEDEGYYELYLEESFIEDELAANPEMLGLGDLKLIDRQKVTPVGRPDLIFYQEERDLHIIVELKKYEITKADVEQATRYHNWGKKKYGNRLITLLIGFWIEEDVLPRLENLKDTDSGIFALVYDAQFKIL